MTTRSHPGQSDPLRIPTARVSTVDPLSREASPRLESQESCTETWYVGRRTAQAFLDSACLGHRRLYRKGTTLYSQGELGSDFFFVLSGRIQVSIFQKDGTEFILEIMGRHAICGEGAAVDGGPRIATAIALEDAEVVAFDISEIRNSFSSRMELASALLQVVAVKQRVLGMRIASLAMPRPELRICELLHRLAGLYGRPDGAGVRVPIALTHEHIAALTGTSRVTVTRALKRLRHDGVLDVQRRGFLILDLRRLVLY